MTTAHRPTFDPARGRDAQRGPAYHQRLLAAHTHLKERKAGQGGAADSDSATTHDLRAELLRAEAAVQARKRAADGGDAAAESVGAELRGGKRMKGLGGETLAKEEGVEAAEGLDEEAERRRRILEDARDADADSTGSRSEEEDSDEDDSEEESEDDDDDEAELMRELAKVKAERAAAKAKEEEQREKAEQERREKEIALGNPLLNRDREQFKVKRPWDEDVVFKNQARGVEEQKKAAGREFVNDTLRSTFHKRFMDKYVK